MKIVVKHLDLYSTIHPQRSSLSRGCLHATEVKPFLSGNIATILSLSMEGNEGKASLQIKLQRKKCRAHVKDIGILITLPSKLTAKERV